jgi:hypothetical protein
LTPSGTGFAIAGALLNKDGAFLEELLRTSELAGFSVQRAGRRCYAIAPLVGDAILLAMKTAGPWDERYRHTGRTKRSRPATFTGRLREKP